MQVKQDSIEHKALVALEKSLATYQTTDCYLEMVVKGNDIMRGIKRGFIRRADTKYPLVEPLYSSSWYRLLRQAKAGSLAVINYNLS